MLSARRAVTEGVSSAPAIAALAEKAGVNMPICEAVNAILDGRMSVEAAMEDLLSRPFTVEGD